MAGVLLHVNSGTVSLVASTAKTVLQIKAPANQRLLIKGLKLIGNQPAGGTDSPVMIRITRSSSNFGTGSAATPAKNDPTDSETIQSTAFANFSVEPTSPTDGGLRWPVQPQSGVIEFLPLGMEIKVPGGTSVNFECTSPATPSLVLTASYEE